MEFSKNIKYQIYIYYKVANIFSIARKLLTSDQFLTTLPILTTGGRISRTCLTTTTRVSFWWWGQYCIVVVVVEYTYAMRKAGARDIPGGWSVNIIKYTSCCCSKNDRWGWPYRPQHTTPTHLSTPQTSGGPYANPPLHPIWLAGFFERAKDKAPNLKKKKQ